MAASKITQEGTVLSVGYPQDTVALIGVIKQCAAIPFEEREGSRLLMSELLDKWSLNILMNLTSEGRLRFNALARHLEGISQKVLTRTLRDLERDGLVDRTIFSEVPVRVEYAITAEGQELLRLTTPIYVWLINHRKKQSARHLSN
jgi:DNA-binding HxlR family transcriptional regulator